MRIELVRALHIEKRPFAVVITLSPQRVYGRPLFTKFRQHLNVIASFLLSTLQIARIQRDFQQRRLAGQHAWILRVAIQLSGGIDLHVVLVSMLSPIIRLTTQFIMRAQSISLHLNMLTQLAFVSIPMNFGTIQFYLII